MKTVWKTTLILDDLVEADLPVGAKALSCSANPDYSNAVDLWWLVDSEAQKDRVGVVIAGTGHSLDSRVEGRMFLGTTFHGSLRFHVFVPAANHHLGPT